MNTEDRVYIEKIRLQPKETMEDWLAKRQNHFAKKAVIRKYSEREYDISFYYKTQGLQYLLCNFVVSNQNNLSELEISNMYYYLNYSRSEMDSTEEERNEVNIGKGGKNGSVKAGIARGMGRGILGPTNKKEFDEILIPCVETFLYLKKS